MNDTGVVAGPASGQTGRTHRLRGLAGTGLIATLAAMAATTLAAALAQAVGIGFEVPDGGESANTATTTALLGLHLVPATVMIPTLARSLRNRTDR